MATPDAIVSIADIRSKAHANFGDRERGAVVGHDELVRRAQAYPPKEAPSTVSSFSDWVFELYQQGSDAAKQRGREAEREAVDYLLQRKRDQWWKQVKEGRIAKMRRSAVARFPNDEWRLEFDGTNESLAESLEISVLRIGAAVVRGKPDLVYRHIPSQDVLILELKTWNGEGRLPPFGWPNMKVQLWCYGLVDRWRDAPHVFLQGCVWRLPNTRGWRFDDITGADKPDIQQPGLVLQPWLSNDPRVHTESLALFEAYGGRYQLCRGGIGGAQSEKGGRCA